MLEAVAHVGVGGKVEHRVAALQRVSKQLVVEHVALERTRRPGRHELLDELAPPAREVVVEHDLDPSATSRSARLLPMKPAPPVMRRVSDRHYSVKPAETASLWNI